MIEKRPTTGPWIRALVRVNLVVPLLLSLAWLADAFDVADVPWAIVPLAIAVVVLAVVSVVACLTFWRHVVARAWLVPLALVASIVLTGVPAYLIGEWRLNRIPIRPGAFLREDRKASLERIAESLLRSDVAGAPEAGPVRVRVEGLPEPDAAVLRRHRFREVVVDRSQGRVHFRYYRPRTWVDYAYSVDDVDDPWVRRPNLTQEDVSEWSEFRRIVTEYESSAPSSLSFDAAFARELLRQSLGAEHLREYAAMPQVTTDDERRRIVAALDAHRMAESRLVERPEVRLSAEGLHAGALLDTSWGSRLGRQLVDDTVLVVHDGVGHLRLTGVLDDAERARLEWLHVAILDRVFGDLVEKRPLEFQRKLDDHWVVSLD